MFKLYLKGVPIVEFEAHRNEITYMMFLSENHDPIQTKSDIVMWTRNMYGRLLLERGSFTNRSKTIRSMLNELVRYEMRTYMYVHDDVAPVTHNIKRDDVQFMSERELGNSYIARRLYMQIFGNEDIMGMQQLDAQSTDKLGLDTSNADLIALYNLLTLQRNRDSTCIRLFKDGTQDVIPAPIFTTVFREYDYWCDCKSLDVLMKHFDISFDKTTYRFDETIIGIPSLEWPTIVPTGSFTVSYYTDIVAFVNRLCGLLAERYLP